MRCFTLFLALCSTCLAIEPDNLSGNWQAELERGPELVREWQGVLPTMTEAKQQEAKELLGHIEADFKAQREAKETSPISVPLATPIADEYPIDEAMALDRQLRSSLSDLKALKDERHEKLAQLDEAQDHLDKLSKAYGRTSERTEDHFIAGLKLIDAQIALQVAKTKWTRLENGVVALEGFIKRLKEELERAEEKLVATPDEVEQLKRQEPSLITEMKLALATLLVEPDDLGALGKKLKEWKKQLAEMSKRKEELSQAAERQVKRAESREALEEAQSQLLATRKLEGEINDGYFLLDQLQIRVTELLGGAGRLAQWLKSFWSGVFDWIETPLFYLGTKPIALSGLLKFFFILILTFWISGRVVSWLTHLAITKKRIERSVLYRINRLVYYLLLTLGLIFALISLGFDFSNFLLIAGALGVGLGFGLQTIFNNFISGLILLFESHIKVGDFIEIASGVRGEVKEINVRSTIVGMNDGLDAIIPNSEMISNRVVNWTLSHPYRRITVPFTVAYGTDKELVRKIVIESALKVPETLIKPGFSDPSVQLKEFGPAGLDFELHIWVNEKYSKLPGKSLSDYLWTIDDTLKEHNVEVPFPRTDIKVLA